MQSFVHFGFVAALTALITGGLAWLIGRARPAALSADSGTIAPERWSALFTVIFGGIFVVGGGVAVFAGQWSLGLGAIVMGAAIGGFMAPSLTNAHVVTWSGDHVQGPSKMFGPTLGLAKTQIKWRDIVSTGKTTTGYWFIETKDRRRIYWSYLYKGYGAFVGYLRTRCPNLALHDDLAA